MSDLLNKTELAAKMRRPRQFLTMMIRAGYKMEYPALGRSTLEHALGALKRAENFRAAHYEKAGWERLPRLLAEPSNPQASVVGKSY